MLSLNLVKKIAILRENQAVEGMMPSMNFNFEVKVKSAYEALSQAVNLLQIYLNDLSPASSS